jgi:hypothetical protein
VPRLTIRRHAFFSPATAERLDRGLEGAAAWDTLRTSETEPSFGIPATREAWESQCGQAFLVERGAAIAAMAYRLGVKAIVSFGVGGACVEYQIHQANPQLALHLSDFAPKTVRRLRKLFLEAGSVSVVDLRRDDLPRVQGALALLHRIDTEFDDEELRQVFARLSAAGHGLILVVPTGFLTVRELVVEGGRRVAARARLRRATTAGHVRTRAVYDTFWRGLYEVRSEGHLDGDGHYVLLAAPGTDGAGSSRITPIPPPG